MTLDEARARMADPTLFIEAEKNVDRFNKQVDNKRLNSLAHLIQMPAPQSAKVILLKRLTDELAKGMRGIGPCREGCAHCCHMATNITVQEAEALSKASGRPMTIPAVWNEFETVEKFQGAPCPFLIENRCSVYDSRPFACRVHYSLDRDNLLCKIIPGEEIRTPNLDTMKFTMVHMLSYGDPTQVKFADIREFFPSEEA